MKVKDASDNNVNENDDFDDVGEISYAYLYSEPVDAYDDEFADDDDDFADEDEEDYLGGSRKGHLSRRDRFDPDMMRKIWKPNSRSNSKRW